jgi:spectinomycin phosphotransferase
MLEKPDIQDERIVRCVQEEYGLVVAEIVFLPLGADQNTAVYRLATKDGTPCFVKLRQGTFDRLAVMLPRFLYEQGITQVIPPLATRTDQLWTGLGAFEVILYPFVEGRDCYQVDLSDRHWVEFGAALKKVHTVTLPPGLKALVERERYSARWREIVQGHLVHLGDRNLNDPVAADLASFLQDKRQQILELVDRAERLARSLQARPRPFVLCHSDVHAGNILIGSDDALYIVDWDNPILAAKERDLMYAGGAQGFTGHTSEQEKTLFYEGYGQTEIDAAALAYYRYERIIEDIAVYCDQLFQTTEGGRDREQSLRYLKSNFLPGGTIEIACESDRTTAKEPS